MSRHAGVDAASAVTSVTDALRRRRETLCVVESCTGGWLGRELTAEPGVSDVFWGGVIAYADEAKVRLAGVAPDLIATNGAVSEAVALGLAEGMRARSGADWSVSITGVAGPGGGTRAKPVGTVWIAVAGADGAKARKYQLAGDRSRIRAEAVEAALNELRRRLESAA